MRVFDSAITLIHINTSLPAFHYLAPSRLVKKSICSNSESNATALTANAATPPRQAANVEVEVKLTQPAGYQWPSAMTSNPLLGSA